MNNQALGRQKRIPNRGPSKRSVILTIKENFLLKYLVFTVDLTYWASNLIQEDEECCYINSANSRIYNTYNTYLWFFGLHQKNFLKLFLLSGNIFFI